MTILILLAGIVIGVTIAIGMRDDKQSAANAARTAAVQDAHRRVLALFDGKPEITNDDVQRALGVSDSTATAYLSALEAQGRIAQVGDTGRGVVYRKRE